MKRMISLAALALAVAALPLAAQERRGPVATNFASDTQTLPVVANVNGIGGSFTTYVALFNPTASSFPVNATFYDANGTKKTATISLGAGELKTFTNFVNDLFNTTGGGAVTLSTNDTAGSTRNNRFIVTSEIRSNGYSTMVPAAEFPGSTSQSFAAGITVDSSARTNIGCFNQSDAANKITARVFSSSGSQPASIVELNLPANGWGQTAVTNVVSNGYVQFLPSQPATCYAVVVMNGTNDGRFIPAAEYLP